MKLMQRINPQSTSEKMESNDKESSRKSIIKLYILCPIVMAQTAATASKYIKKNLFLIFINICHIPEWILLIFRNALFF